MAILFPTATSNSSSDGRRKPQREDGGLLIRQGVYNARNNEGVGHENPAQAISVQTSGNRGTTKAGGYAGWEDDIGSADGGSVTNGS